MTTEELFARSLAFVERQEGQTFAWRGGPYTCVAAQEREEEAYMEGSGHHKTHRSVTIEATAAQFTNGYPADRDPIEYRGHHYTVRSREIDALTLKLTCARELE